MAYLYVQQGHIRQPRFRIAVRAARALHDAGATSALHPLTLQAVTTRSSVSDLNATTTAIREVSMRYLHSCRCSSAGTFTRPALMTLVESTVVMPSLSNSSIAC